MERPLEALLAALRESTLTDAEIARRTGASQVYIWQLRKGKRNNPGYIFTQLCNLLGIDPITGEKVDISKQEGIRRIHGRVIRSQKGHPPVLNATPIIHVLPDVIEMSEEEAALILSLRNQGDPTEAMQAALASIRIAQNELEGSDAMIYGQLQAAALILEGALALRRKH